MQHDPNCPERATINGAAEILRTLSHEIELVGAALCEDPELMGRHMTALQSIDLIAQKQRALADVFVATSPSTAIADIPVEVLRDELRARFAA
ncbi:hypothetical protein GCM10023219_03840 [Stakelama sediminis]|uniref:Uncharacterized protein n=1 Tax=Stakelama sediminis TaxID=463200 RepID=A0A840YU45_9SPHN|nr:hypothetical protein [Stakelama sediminis]MBB5717097.1 hypothetical protein [Stakelama sediminis]